MAFAKMIRPMGRGYVVWMGLGLLALFAVLRSLHWVVDWLWMRQLGFEPVFWRILFARAGLFVAALVPVLLYFWFNLRAIRRTVALSGEVHGTALSRVLGFLRGPWAGTAVLGISGVLALFLALSFQGAWQRFLLFWFGGSFGESEPILGQDIGFYVFDLPFLESVYGLLLTAALIGTVLQAGTFYGLGIVQNWGAADERLTQRARLLLCANGAFFAAVWAADYVLARFRLLYASSGTVIGPGYTDVNVVLPALWAMTAVMLAVVIALLWSMRKGGGRIGLMALAAAGVLHIGLLWVLPFSVQRLAVAPNELEREKPYLVHNIRFTRQGFALDRVTERDFPASASLKMADLAKHQPTIRNIRLWDYRPLLTTFRQIQEIRLYYRFYDVDVDRYETEDGLRQVMVSARELTPELPSRADTWLNRTLQYTHGYGLAMSLAVQEGSQGSPSLIVKDLPPATRDGLKADDVAIYYGERTPGYKIVNTGIRELDYPKGDDNVYTHYQGTGGIPLNSSWKRILFAINQGDIGILLSEYISSESRIQIRQQIRERIDAVAPFLRLDADPYLVLNGGRLVWIQDAYTASDRYPYSESYSAPRRSRRASSGPVSSPRPAAGPVRNAHAFRDPVNYARNSVKIVVDALSGNVSFYVIDEDDPILAAWRRAFSGLFQPLDALPAGLKAHLRYPQDLFEAQIARYSAYHMRTPQVFYNKEDLWTIPWEKYGGRRELMEPYYILVRLPGEERTEFLLMTPYTPESRDNMIAWMAARSDFPGYGELIVFKLPKERLTYGPMQVEALIDQDTTISRQLSLWDQRGSKVIRGNLLVIPIEDSLIYVEPVYLVAEEHDVPQLKRVIVGQGDKVAMRPTLYGALAALFGADDTRPERQTPTPGALQAPSPEIKAAMGRAEKALAAGDWSAFGRAMSELKRLLSNEEGSSGSPPGAGDEQPSSDNEAGMKERP